MENCLALVVKWLVAWKRGLPRPNVSHKCLSPPHALSYTITKKIKRVLCDAKVIEGPEAPEGSLRVLFRLLSDRVLFRVLSDRILFESSVTGSSVIDFSLGSSVLFFRHAANFYQNVLLLFFNKSRCSVLHYIFKKNFTLKIAKKWRNTCMNSLIYKLSMLLNIL